MLDIYSYTHFTVHANVTFICTPGGQHVLAWLSGHLHLAYIRTLNIYKMHTACNIIY
jgi:hypothetical protein